MDTTNNWTVYIVQCSDDTLYTGICCDVQRRLHEHNYLKRAARYTRVRRPVTLVYQEQVDSRSTAAQREYRIKQMSVNEKRALIKQSPAAAQVATQAT
jgi:putative endonuclease